MSATTTAKAVEVRKGVRAEVFGLACVVIEAAVSLGAGIVAGSVLLTAFGIDSLIELVSGAMLLWRLSVETQEQEEEGNNDGVERVERAEHRAAWVVGISLALLCVYVVASTVYDLATSSEPEASPVGLAISAFSVVVMPYLGILKRRIAGRIDSAALHGDAANSIACGYLAGAVLVGVSLNALLGWWWAEAVVTPLFLFWLVRETKEELDEARSQGS